ncbi:hypothetical protein CISG_07804 [Coccidioides immitis RMSCC 3703]|uniref:Uncharacterized protein n=3 Tax=Coccidioides TaxID=5500 RepID=E9DFQ7_COCPS|nr:conserved hypothetical protein [Coccidioides posadasii str. Silveira]KMM63770.1 hypothetical protein CPAG_00124 [Coccidioides posadasii RMSCC 3488]KMU79400.1 hypothetical protein CISG_07804 [Coccidioides immitis RMSCC 3703]
MSSRRLSCPVSERAGERDMPTTNHCRLNMPTQMDWHPHIRLRNIKRGYLTTFDKRWFLGTSIRAGCTSPFKVCDLRLVRCKVPEKYPHEFLQGAARPMDDAFDVAVLEAFPDKP